MTDADGNAREVSIIRYRGLTGLGLPKSVVAVAGDDGKLAPLNHEDGEISVFGFGKQEFQRFQDELKSRLGYEKPEAEDQDPAKSGQAEETTEPQEESGAESEPEPESESESES